jgi:pyridoxine 5-phosphate synthase
MPLLLGVNVDHVATLRQARYAKMPGSHNEEPSLLAAALLAEESGAHSITIHLREDRRHIQDRDVFACREHLRTKLNLEMGNAAEIIAIAEKVRPDFACLVPEKREEVTTEGGLDVVGGFAALQATVRRLQAVGTRVSMFIDPVAEQIEASARLGAEMVELHTGTYANTTGEERTAELNRLVAGAKQAHQLGLQVNAGHGITTANLAGLFALPHLTELNIGHHIISRSVFIGLPGAIREMLAVMAGYPEH